jgi:hypothetical protein
MPPVLSWPTTTSAVTVVPAVTETQSWMAPTSSECGVPSPEAVLPVVSRSRASRSMMDGAGVAVGVGVGVGVGVAVSTAKVKWLAVEVKTVI